MEVETRAIGAYVDAAAQMIDVSLDAEWRAGVIATMQRLAAFADDVGAAGVRDDTEIAGVFVP